MIFFSLFTSRPRVTVNNSCQFCPLAGRGSRLIIHIRSLEHIHGLRRQPQSHVLICSISVCPGCVRTQYSVWQSPRHMSCDAKLVSVVLFFKIIQSTLVISNSKRLSEILRDICTSTYQICRFMEKIIRLTTSNKYICVWTLVRDILKILWKRGEIAFSSFPQ